VKSPKTDINFKNISESEITTILAEDINFKGDIHFKSSLMVKGVYQGNLTSDGLLIIGSGAKVKANIKTGILVSHGFIEGNIEAVKSIILCSTANLKGDIITPNLIVESGAKFLGNSNIPIEQKKQLPERPLEEKNKKNP